MTCKRSQIYTDSSSRFNIVHFVLFPPSHIRIFFLSYSVHRNRLILWPGKMSCKLFTLFMIKCSSFFLAPICFLPRLHFCSKFSSTTHVFFLRLLHYKWQSRCTYLDINELIVTFMEVQIFPIPLLVTKKILN